MKPEVRSLVQAMILARRAKRDKMLGIKMAQALEGIPLASSASRVRLDRVCAQELGKRARLWLDAVVRVMSTTHEPWTTAQAQECETLIVDALAEDTRRIGELFAGKFRNEIDPKEARSLSDELGFAGDHVRHEMQLLALSEETSRIPLADQLRAPRYAAVAVAWNKASEALGKPGIDTKTVVVESVAAVEQLARLVIGKPTATLGDAIRELRASQRIAAPLLKGFEELWGWTSSEPGFRHGAAAEPPADASEARYVWTVAQGALLLLLARDEI